MAQAADTGGISAYAKLVDQGDKIIGAFASSPKECQRQSTNYKTGELEYKDNGKPKLEEVMWFIACPGITAKKGNVENGYEPIEAGDTILFSVNGYKWKQVIDARKALPAANGFKAGQPCSGDIYEIELVSWSAQPTNLEALRKEGFHIEDGRIVLRTQDEKDRYVVLQSRAGGNTNAAKDLKVTVRRPTADEKAWEQAADELFLAKPWKRAPALVGAGGPSHDIEDEEAF